MIFIIFTIYCCIENNYRRTRSSSEGFGRQGSVSLQLEGGGRRCHRGRGRRSPRSGHWRGCGPPRRRRRPAPWSAAEACGGEGVTTPLLSAHWCESWGCNFGFQITSGDCCGFFGWYYLFRGFTESRESRRLPTVRRPRYALMSLPLVFDAVVCEVRSAWGVICRFGWYPYGC